LQVTEQCSVPNGGASRAGRVRGRAFARKQTESALSRRFTRAIARSRACAGCDPFARNHRSSERWGMSGKGQVTEGCHGLAVTRTLTTVYPFRCDDAAISYTKSVKTSTPDPQVEG